MAKTKSNQSREGRSSKAGVIPGAISSPPSTSRGRPRGKRSDPEFTPLYAYIRKSTHKEVKIKLIQQGERDLSELLDELLTAWLKSDV